MPSDFNLWSLRQRRMRQILQDNKVVIWNKILYINKTKDINQEMCLQEKSSRFFCPFIGILSGQTLYLYWKTSSEISLYLLLGKNTV